MDKELQERRIRISVEHRIQPDALHLLPEELRLARKFAGIVGVEEGQEIAIQRCFEPLLFGELMERPMPPKTSRMR